MHSALAGSHINIIHPFNWASRGLCRRRKGNTGQFSARNLPNLANSVQMQQFSTCLSQCRVSEMHWLIVVSHMSINYVLKPVSRAYCQGRKWDTLQISTNILKNLLQYDKRHELITFQEVHACSETCNSSNPGCFFVSAACLQKHCLLVLLCVLLLSLINPVWKHKKTSKNDLCVCFETVPTIRNGLLGPDLPLKAPKKTNIANKFCY